MKSANHLFLLCAFFLFAPFSIFSQTFNGVGGLPVPPGAPSSTQGITTSDAVVSGVGVLGGCNEIDNVTLDLEHSWTGDIAIFLQSPGGSILELSSGNGGSGDNFQVTTFSDDATLNVTAGAPPFNGGFRPEGRQQSTNCFCPNTNPIETWTFANTFDGENADGAWQLIINDYVIADVGILNSWSITFTQGGTPPTANPASINLCDEGGGQASFDLTSVESTVNGGTSDPVEWYTDVGATIPISTPSAYVSGNATVYAVVVGGGCSSLPVPVTLTVLPAPTAIALEIDVCDNCGGFTEVDLTSYDDQVNGGSGNPVSWWGNAAATLPVPNPTNVQIMGASYWATVSNGTCESQPVEVDFTLLIPNCGAFTSLSACDDGSGSAVFDLTSINEEVNNGTGDLVTWYLDMNATIPIVDPANFSSSGGLVYAVIFNGTCPSPAIAVTLSVTPGLNPANVQINVTPNSLCGSGNVLVSFTFPTSGFYNVEMNFGNSTSGFNLWQQTILSGTNYPFPISETTEFQLYFVEEASGGCSITFAPPLTEIVTVAPAPQAFPASLEGCGQNGSPPVYDLTSLNNIVNGGTGLPVNWFTDAGASVSISDPANYSAPGGTVYANVGTPPCVSGTVPITLTFTITPNASIYPLDACDDGSGTGAFDLTSIEGFVNLSTGLPVTWFTDAGATNPISNPSNYVSGEGQVWAVVTNGNCPSDPVAIDLNLVPTPTVANASITANPTELCGPGNVSITFNMPEAGVDFTVQMDYGNPSSGYQNYIGANVNDGSVVNFPITETTEFILNSVAVENNGLCEVTFANPVTVTVVVNDPPSILLTLTPTICEGESYDISAVVSTTSGLPITFHSAIPPSPANELPSSVVSPNSTTIFYGFVDGGVGCTVVMPITVFVNPEETPNLGTATICESETNYDLTQLLDPAYPTGTWSGPGVSGNSFNATGQSGNVTLTFDPDTPCATVSTTTVAISSAPAPPLSDTLVSCDEGSGQAIFDLTSIEAQIGGGNPVNWYLDPAGTQPIGNPTAYLSPLATVYASSGQGGCESATSPIELYFLPALTEANTFVDISPLTGCGPTPVNITTNVPSPGEYLVQMYYGNPATSPPYTTGFGVGYGPSGTSFSFLVSENTAFVVNNAVSTFNGVNCFYELDPLDTIVVTVEAPPILLTQSPVICEGESTDLTLAVSNPTNAILTFHSASPPSAANQLPSPIVSPTVTTVYYAQADNGAGCTSDTAIPVNVTSSVTPTLGTDDICENETSYDLTQLADPAFPNGTWSGPGVAGNVFVATGLSGPVTLTYDPPQPCTETVTTVVNVVTSLTPQLGTAQVCVSSAPIPLLPLADPAFPLGTWSGPGVAGNTFSPVGLSGVVILTFDPDDACAETATTTVTIDDQPDLILIGIPQICQGEVFDLAAATLTSSGLPVTFHFADPPTSANQLPSPVVSPIATTTYFAFVDGGGDCTATLPVTLNVSVASTPNLTNGSICESETFFDLTILQDPAFPTGTWSGPGASGTVFLPAGQTGTVTLTFTSDEICVLPATAEMTVETEVLPNLGADAVCASETNFDLNTLIDPAFPTGTWDGPGVSGTNFNATGLNGTVTLIFTSDEACTSLATTTILVLESVEPTLGTAEVCESETNFDLNSLSDPAYPTGTWSGPGVSGNNFNAIGQNGVVTLTFAPDDDCAETTTTTVEVSPQASPNLSGASVCAGSTPLDLTTLIDPTFPTGTWSGPGVSGNSFSPVGQTGAVTLTFTPDGDCGQSATTTVAINEAPTVVNLETNCDGTNAEYTVSFDIAGGDPGTYEVDGLPSGVSFTSPPILSGGTYSFQIDDGNACGPLDVGGSFNCDCVTFAGTMDLSGSPFEVCADATFLASANLDEVLDLNDVLQFILHDEAGPTLGNVLAINDLPQFSFPAAGVLGITYYVSAVAANDDGTGNFDPTDGCLSVSAGVPVVFYEPAVSTGAGGEICGGTCFDIPLTFSGVAPFELSYSVSTSDTLANEVLTTNLTSAVVTICPDDWNITEGEITFSVAEMTDGNDCSVDVSGQPNVAILVFSEPVSFLNPTLCSGETLTVGGELFSETNPTGEVIFPNGAASGCDSVVMVALEFAPEASFLLNPTLCVGTGLTVNGTFYNQLNPVGVEVLANASVNGCDSTVTIALSFDNVVTTTLDPTLCPGESLTVNGILYDESNPTGSELFENGASSGCDSLVEINLTFAAPASGQISQTLCAGESVEVNGTIYDESNSSGTEILSNASVNGCDSTVTIALSFDNVVTTTLDPILCPGESLTVNGTVYDETNPSGSELFTGASGCDSLVVIDLIFNGVVTFELSDTLCPIESLTVNGTVYDVDNPSGVELFENGSAGGCDSLVVIELEFFEIPLGPLPVFLCEGETFTFNGVLFDESNPIGAVPLVGAASTGCDSIVLVSLFYFDPPEEDLNLTLCEGESVEINGEIFNENNPTGQVIFPDVTFAGCDSILNVNLTFLPESVTNLADTLSLGGSLTVNGTAYDESNPNGVEVIVGGAANGCDSTINISLFFVEEEIEIQANAQPITCAGDADGQVVLENVSGGSGTYFVSFNFQPAFSVTDFPLVIENLLPGNYSIVVSDDTGLSNMVELVVSSPPEIILDLGDDLTVELGDDANFNAITNILPATVDWTPRTFLDCDNCLDPIVEQPSESINYTLTIADENGCSATDDIKILLRKSRTVFVPNVFSPNGDGTNDRLTVFAGNDVVNIRTFQIFDRWGGAVFEAYDFQPNDLSLGWDGMARGEMMNPAVFVYYAEVEFLDGEIILLKGEVALVR